MNDKPHGIPVREFVALEEQAREAYKRGDWQTIASINARLADMNGALFWENGECYLMTLKRGDHIPPGIEGESYD